MGSSMHWDFLIAEGEYFRPSNKIVDNIMMTVKYSGLQVRVSLSEVLCTMNSVDLMNSILHIKRK